MIKDYFINSIEIALKEAVIKNKLGQMTEYKDGTLVVERPKNSDFGDFAVNVSSLARYAKIAPPQIANAILEYIDKDDNQYTVVGGFINFKAGKKLSVEEMELLLKELSRTPHPYTCPHGRPTIIKFSSADLAKMFHRS